MNTTAAQKIAIGGATCVLVLAMGLKIVSLFWTGLHSLDALHASAIVLESIVILVAISRATTRTKMLLLMSVFLGFAVYSIYLVSGGMVSCGCFGIWSPPIHLVAIGDLVVSALLFAVCPIPSAWSVPQVMNRGVVRAASASVVVAIGMVLVFRIGSLAEASGPENSKTIRKDADEKRVVFLHPRRWIDHQFPLASEVAISENLLRGKWVVAFVSHTCQACRTERAHFADLANELKEKHSDTRVACIQVPPLAPDDDALFSSSDDCAHGALPDGVAWVIDYPCSVIIEDGVVTFFSTGISEK